MMSEPSELIADWMMMFENEKSIPCMPAGIPIRSISLRTEASILMYFLSRRISSLLFKRRKSMMRALVRFEMTVAMATPSASRPSTMTKNMFSPTFRMPATTRQMSGVLVSPFARKTADSKL